MSKRFTLTVNEKALVQQMITILKTWPTKFGSNKAIAHVLYKYATAPVRRLKPGDLDILAYDFRGVCWMAAQQININRLVGYRKRGPSFSSSYFFNDFTRGISKDLCTLLSYIHRLRLNGPEAIAALTDFASLGIYRNMAFQDFRESYKSPSVSIATVPATVPATASADGSMPLLAINTKIGDVLIIELPVTRKRIDGLPVTVLGFFDQKLYARYVKSVKTPQIELNKVYDLVDGVNKGVKYKTIMYHAATDLWLIESTNGKEVKLVKPQDLYQC